MGYVTPVARGGLKLGGEGVRLLEEIVSIRKRRQCLGWEETLSRTLGDSEKKYEVLGCPGHAGSEEGAEGWGACKGGNRGSVQEMGEGPVEHCKDFRYSRIRCFINGNDMKESIFEELFPHQLLY